MTTPLAPEEAAAIRRLCARLRQRCDRQSEHPHWCQTLKFERDAQPSGRCVVALPSLRRYGGPGQVMGEVLSVATDTPFGRKPTVYAVPVGGVLRWVDEAMELTGGGGQ